jgi:pre-rRNA-processing protein IPI1
LVTLRTILAFLRASLGHESSVSAEDVFKSVFGNECGDAGGKGKGKARQVTEHELEEQYEGFLVGCSQWGLEEPAITWEIGRLEATSSLSGKEVELEALTVSFLDYGQRMKRLAYIKQQLYTQLHPLLLSTFLEAAPNAFSPSSSSFSTADDTSLELCSVTAALAEILARSILAHDADTADIRAVRSIASDFLKRMAAWFPFSNPTSATSSGVSPAFELSLTYSKLAILLAPRPKGLVFPKGKKEVGWKVRIRATEESWKEMKAIGKGKGKGRSADGWALEEVSEWIISVLVRLLAVSSIEVFAKLVTGTPRCLDTQSDTACILGNPRLDPPAPPTSSYL